MVLQLGSGSETGTGCSEGSGWHQMAAGLPPLASQAVPVRHSPLSPSSSSVRHSRQTLAEADKMIAALTDPVDWCVHVDAMTHVRVQPEDHRRGAQDLGDARDDRLPGPQQRPRWHGRLLGDVGKH